ncbi:hypothetical protein ACFL9T_21885 [Thermodesulfobacteriota bacterium]
MCCGTENRQGDFCGCGCGGKTGYMPRFMTRDQKIAKLEQYLAGLQDEAKGVEEHIANIQEEK